jgi:predicted DNA-binding protein
MKTAISVPDATFERVSRRAAALGMSRSKLFARAAERYLDQLDATSLTDQIDDVLQRVGQPHDESAADAVTIGRQTLFVTDDDW